MICLRAFVVAALLPGTSLADTVFDAVPTSRVLANAETSQRDLLSPAKQHEYRLIITKVDGKYYWATRGNTLLNYTKSGIFRLFIDPQGGGYIEVSDSQTQSESLRAGGARFKYKEHLRSGTFGVRTYFGESAGFSP
jgi:hypothetical protein